jgi:hypothetical protein
MECDRCDDDVPATVELNHVHFDTSPVSALKGTYRVCFDCRDELEANPDVTW